MKNFDVIDHEMAEILAQKTERQRLEIAFGMWTSVRELLRQLIRSEHPDWSETEVALEAGRRMASATE